MISSLTIFLLSQTISPDPLVAGWEGQSVCEVLQDDAALRVLRCTFAPGQGHELHTHAPHWGYILESGTMQVTDERGTRTIETPAGATWRRDEPYTHEALNVGDTTTSYLIVEPKAEQN